MRELRGDGGQGGGGQFRKLQKEPEGTTVRGEFVRFEKQVPSQNPAYAPQDIVTLNVDGATVKVPCTASLSRTFTNNAVEPGTLLDITYEGKKAGKAGKTFHSFKVIVVEDPGFDVAAPNAPVDDLEAKLAAARARRAAGATA